MEEERYQKELFEFEKPKRAFPRFGRIFTRSNFAITLTVEKIVFISIGIIMLMVIIYALGVERGKAFGKSGAAAISRPPIVRTTPSLPTAQVAQVSNAAVMKSHAVSARPVEVKPAQLGQDISKPYTIVAVTLTRKDTATAGANRLKKEGFDSFVVESEPYFLVCVGAYPDKNSAQSKKALARIKQFYKDAYFKLK